jgi:hypothetical protein
MEQNEIINKIIGVLKLIDQRDYKVHKEKFIKDQVNEKGD